MAEAFNGFEARVDRAITDLEDALLGITDEDIREVLRLKNFELLDETRFREFKDQVKDTLLDRLIENGRQQPADKMEVASQSTSESADFDITCSSYMKIGPGHRGPDGATDSDIDRLMALANVSSEDSQDFGNFSLGDGGRELADRLTSENDFLRANPEFAQSTFCRRSSPHSPNSRAHRRRANSVSSDFGRNDPQASQYCKKRKAFEDFVRHECKTQMDLITGPNQSVWVPTRPKCSPQVRYYQYKKIWDKFPIPGEKPRRELRWAIRNQLAKKEEPQKQSWWPEVKSP
ncbi:uncharacterized protein LOC108864790 [Galendromus occidentalis]|uniref:Uncharacterized protein LOC108864790 n=1 Tax=Galendromus occidentalis TaxID=34638 RepID=A0AAJ7PAG6_9ACAR|nr:uncharacterized protein LOC108864790 [Galendromus occidentalis]